MALKEKSESKYDRMDWEMWPTRLFNFDDVIDRSYKMRFCTGNGNKTDCRHGDALFSTVNNNVTRGTVEFCGVGYSTISGIAQIGANRHTYNQCYHHP